MINVFDYEKIGIGLYYVLLYVLDLKFVKWIKIFLKSVKELLKVGYELVDCIRFKFIICFFLNGVLLLYL